MVVGLLCNNRLKVDPGDVLSLLPQAQSIQMCKCIGSSVITAKCQSYTKYQCKSLGNIIGSFGMKDKGTCPEFKEMVVRLIWW